MRTMYDAVTARNIPRDPPPALVAGYVDKIKLEPWSAADWALFPNSIKVRIVKKASTNDGHVLDVEPGDATPAEAPGWVVMRRKAAVDPTVYCNYSTWPAVQAAFNAAGVPHPHYWIAKYDGVANLPILNGIRAVAKQYLGDQAPGFDKSCVDDFWPGVDAPSGPSPASDTTPTRGDDMALIRIPKGGSNNAPANFPLAMSMLFEHDVIIAPGDMPVVLFEVYNWGWTGPDDKATPGTGGNPEEGPKTEVVQVKGSYSFIVPKGTGKCDLVYWADDDFTVAIERRV